MRPEIKEKIKARGKIQLMYFEGFTKNGIAFNESIERFQYKKEEDIINQYDNNIANNQYFNIIFLKYDNKEDAFEFIKLFIEKAEESCSAKNNNDYPFFVFFENPKFKKEILYSYYLEKTKKMEISRFYDLKSQNIYFVKTKEDIENLISTEITNYYYEFDFKNNCPGINSNYKLEILFMGQTGCGKSTFINYLLGKLRAFSASMNNFK